MLLLILSFVAEANFKAFIVLIPDIPKYIMEDGQKKLTNVKVGSMLSDFLSTLLILPVSVYVIMIFNYFNIIQFIFLNLI